ETFDRRRHDARRHGGQRPDAEPRSGGSLGPRDAVDAAADGNEAVAGVLEEEIAEPRVANTAAVAFEERRPQRLFEFADGLADRGLADTEYARRLADAALARNLDEGA